MRSPPPTSLGFGGGLVRLGHSSGHSYGRRRPSRPCTWRYDAPTMCMPVEDAKKAVVESPVASRSSKQGSDPQSALSDGSQDPAALTEPLQPLTLQGAWQSAGLPVLVLCCFIGAVCALDRVVMSVAILPMSEQFGYSDSVKGLIASAFSLGYCIGLVPAGVASSSSSPKMVLGIGLVVRQLLASPIYLRMVTPNEGLAICAARGLVPRPSSALSACTRFGRTLSFSHPLAAFARHVRNHMRCPIQP
eukprot:6188138-Pleurochrysis_carterae.AAC.1